MGPGCRATLPRDKGGRHGQTVLCTSEAVSERRKNACLQAIAGESRERLVNDGGRTQRVVERE